MNVETPCFFVINNYLKPIEKSYEINLSNPVSFGINDLFSIKLKIPKQIFGSDNWIELINLDKELENLRGGFQFKSSDGCLNVNNDVNIDIQDICGWFVINISYRFQKEICNLCNISYSICFDPIKVKTLKGSCHNKRILENADIVQYDVNGGNEVILTIDRVNSYICIYADHFVDLEANDIMNLGNVEYIIKRRNGLTGRIAYIIRDNSLLSYMNIKVYWTAENIVLVNLKGNDLIIENIKVRIINNSYLCNNGNISFTPLKI